MHKLSFSRAWDEGIGLLQRNGRLFAAVTLAFVVLPSVLLRFVMPDQAVGGGTGSHEIAQDLLVLSCALLSIVGQVAIMRMAIVPLAQVGESLKVGLRGMTRIVGAIILFVTPLMVVMMVAADQATAHPVAVGSLALLLFAGVLFLAIRLFFFLPLLAVEQGGAVALARRSIQLTKGISGRILLFDLAVLLVAVLLAAASQFALGLVALIALGPPTPMSLSALVIALLTQLPIGLVSCVFSTLVARLAVQRGVGAPRPLGA